MFIKKLSFSFIFLLLFFFSCENNEILVSQDQAVSVEEFTNSQEFKALSAAYNAAINGLHAPDLELSRPDISEEKAEELLHDTSEENTEASEYRAYLSKRFKTSHDGLQSFKQNYAVFSKKFPSVNPDLLMVELRKAKASI